ncbi:MAG: single-stranded-DNA-specific exonuclease RecJ [Holosporales bacterium]|nr:single-stranded-DNA-specific exonuclease RecJ [Holosporales bacterium]
MINSSNGKVWNFLECDKDQVQSISEECNISNIAATILLNRGISDPHEIKSFLDPKLRNTIPDPSLFLGMDEAVTRIAHAVLAHENIMIFGDYDVDGITSTYLMIHYLKVLGIDAQYYIPNRFTDGYGINSEAIQKAKELQIDLFIAVDSGTNSVSEIREANNFGIDVVVLDHHIQTVNLLPNALAIVNPNRNDQPEIDGYYTKNLCAAGVVFMLLIALQRHMRGIGFFNDGRAAADILELADIVALGTLCDVVDLRGFNRAIVKYCMNRGVHSVGISALMRVFNIKRIESPDDLSFFIGPAMNAAGRIGNPLVALELLLESDPENAYKIANKLGEFNTRRKAIEKQMLSEAIAMIDKSNMNSRNGICVYSDDWHEGVIGIVAGRLKDMYNKPAFVIASGKGSARSVPGLHLGDFFTKAVGEGILIGGGGHALAGGFSIDISKIDEFNDFIDRNITRTFPNTLEIDYTLNINTDLSVIGKEIEVLEPFGKGIEKPLFHFPRVLIKKTMPTQTGDHVMLFLQDEYGHRNIRGVIFGISTKMHLSEILQRKRGMLVDIVGFINKNQYGCSIIVVDIRQ